MRILVSFIAVLCLCAGSVLAQENAAAEEQWPRPIIDDPSLEDRRELLLSHGIRPATEDLLAFLKEGFNEEALPMGLPQEPLLKIELVNQAIKELGVTGAEEAVPILMRIAERELPAGISQVLRRDFERVSMRSRGERMELAERMLSLNAITALGLIGDPRAASVVLRVMRTEPATAFTTKGALALGQMGRNDGLGAVVLLAQQTESQDSIAAFRTVYFLIGRNYGYTENTPKEMRQELAQQLETWYENEGKDVSVYRSEVMRRMMNPPPQDTTLPTSLRGLLRASRNVFDYDERYAARQKLQSVARQRVDELIAIVEDEKEDLDIRRAAMTWLAAADPERAKPVIRRQEDDENPEIATLAENLQQDIEEAKDYKEEN